MSIISSESKVRKLIWQCIELFRYTLTQFSVYSSPWKEDLLQLKKTEEGKKERTQIVITEGCSKTYYIDRSVSPENEEEELDEFGRVKRRREKFKTERSEDGEYDDENGNRSDSNDRGRREDRYHSRRHRRRSSSSSSRSPRRSYRRHHSDSDSDYDRHRSSSRHRHRRSTHRSHHGNNRQQNRGNGADVSFKKSTILIDTDEYIL